MLRPAGSNPASKEDADRDLGFGSVVAQASHQRLLNRDGSFNVARTGMSIWSSISPYHWLLTISWGQFLGLTVLAIILINIGFACAYTLCGTDALTGPRLAADGGPFWQAFFFSFHTFATIGYGNVTPNGLAANLIVVVESICALVGTALVTGLIFARFSHPSARIVFSNNAVIAPYRDITGFMFRITNVRKSQIVELTAQVILSLFVEEGGVSSRKFFGLELERNKVTFFPLSWTIVHPIDERSPLFGYDAERLIAAKAEFLILLSGTDETIAQTVHRRSSYRADEVVWNAKFSSMFMYPELNEDQQVLKVDISRIHEIEYVATVEANLDE